MEDLRVALPAIAVIASPIIIGYEAGLFKAEGVNLRMTLGTGANTNNLLLTGQTDIAMGNTTALFALARQGKPTSVIWGYIDSAQGATFVGAPTLTSVDALRAKKGTCSLAAQPAGTGNYAFVHFYNVSLGLNCKEVTYAGVPELIGAVASGRADATASAYDVLDQSIQQGKLSLLIDGRKAQDRQKYSIPALNPYGSLFGVPENLRTKKEAVVRFMRGLAKTQELIQKSSATDLGELLHKWQDFAATPVSTLAQQITFTQPFFNPDGGWVSTQEWAALLQETSNWAGLVGFDPKDPLVAYDQRVDMSYYVAALGKPAGR